MGRLVGFGGCWDKGYGRSGDEDGVNGDDGAMIWMAWMTLWWMYVFICCWLSMWEGGFFSWSKRGLEVVVDGSKVKGAFFFSSLFYKWGSVPVVSEM